MGANYSKTSLITTKLHCNCLAHAMLMDNIIELHLKINACRFFIPLIIIHPFHNRKGELRVLKVRQTEAHSTGLRVSSRNLFNYTQIFPSLKSHHFGKCSHLILLYIIGYNISWRSHDPPSTPHDPQIFVTPPTPQD